MVAEQLASAAKISMLVLASKTPTVMMSPEIGKLNGIQVILEKRFVLLGC